MFDQNNDDSLSARFEIAWRKNHKVEESYRYQFDASNKEQAKIYNELLDVFQNQNLGYSERVELFPIILEQLANDIREHDGVIEYLNEGVLIKDTRFNKSDMVSTKELINNFDRKGSARTLETKNSTGPEEPTNKMLSLLSCGDASEIKDEASLNKEIEQLQHEIATIEKKIAILDQKKRNLEANPLNDTKTIIKDIEALQNAQKTIEKRISKLLKCKIELK